MIIRDVYTKDGKCIPVKDVVTYSSTTVGSVTTDIVGVTVTPTTYAETTRNTDGSMRNVPILLITEVVIDKDKSITIDIRDVSVINPEEEHMADEEGLLTADYYSHYTIELDEHKT